MKDHCQVRCFWTVPGLGMVFQRSAKMYIMAASPTTLESRSSAFITVIESPAEWWQLKQQSWLSLSQIQLAMVGTPFSQRGPVSTASPLSFTTEAFTIPMQVSPIICTTSFPLGSPMQPKPSSFVLPRSSSKATMCLSSSFKWAARQALLPLRGSPHSSPLQAMNLRVLLGLKPDLRISLIASQQVMNPPPSSLAPVCEPVSHESICPPMSSIQSGFSEPLIQKMRLLELVLGTDSFQSCSYSSIFCPLACILENMSASSTVMAAMGILSPYCIPAWTEYIEWDATDLTRAATAPYWAALSPP